MAYTNGFNQIILKGVITTDIQKIEKNGEVIGCNFMVGVNRKPSKKDNQTQAQQQTDYVPCTAWSWTAKHILDKYQKKSPVFIIGQWTSGSYTDRTGKKVYTNRCTVGEVHDMSYGSNQGADNQKPYVDNSVDSVLRVSTADSGAGEYPEIDPDDLPF